MVKQEMKMDFKKAYDAFIERIGRACRWGYSKFTSGMHAIKTAFHRARQNPKSALSHTIQFVFKWWQRILIGLIVFLFILYPVTAFFSSTIDDDASFSGPEVQAPQLQSMKTAEALIKREVNTYGWKANLPFVFPSSMLDNMPAYQMGIIDSLASYAGSFDDEKMQRAAELLSYPGRTWYMNFSSYLKPTTPAQRNYRKARSLMRSYNNDLADGTKQYELTPQHLRSTLNALAEDLRQSAGKIEKKITEADSKMIDWTADDVFYKTKGKLYADALILRDLKTDYVGLIETPEMETAFNDALDSLQKAYQYQPAFILNGAPDGMIVPSHLSTQGFYLLKALGQLNLLQDFVGTLQ